ncbi:MAG: rhodanese-like domain-containing protein [Gaiellaceae bacterium]
MRLFKRPNQVEPRRAAAQLERGRVVVLDVRETIEWKAGRIPGALHIPLAYLPSRRRELPRDQTIVTVCRSGHRSSLAARGLRHAGYRVENLDGGMKAWARARLPLDPRGGRVL